MNNRICSRCGVEKPLEVFHKNKSKPLGHDYWCNVCRNDFDRKRHATPQGIKRNKDYKNSDRGRERMRERLRLDYQKNKHKYAARRMIQKLIKLGVIIREPCNMCGSDTNLRGHHPDYSKPAFVIWLCQKHHSEVHRKNPK